MYCSQKHLCYSDTLAGCILKFVSVNDYSMHHGTPINVQYSVLLVSWSNSHHSKLTPLSNIHDIQIKQSHDFQICNQPTPKLLSYVDSRSLATSLFISLVPQLWHSGGDKTLVILSETTTSYKSLC